uniref:hypothetical protein n=1 Tax=uncultured Allisonella sp. TaxID=339338 RepID=UPI0025968F99
MPAAGIPQIVMLHWQHSKNLHLLFYHRKERQTNHVRTIRLVGLVGLSNICYTVLDEIMECIFWRFPS